MENSIRILLEQNKAYMVDMVCKKYVLWVFSSLSVSSLNSQIIVENHMKLPMLILIENTYYKINENIISNFWIGH